MRLQNHDLPPAATGRDHLPDLCAASGRSKNLGERDECHNSMTMKKLPGQSFQQKGNPVRYVSLNPAILTSKLSQLDHTDSPSGKHAFC
jgi:hypothetical protein